MRKYKKNLSKKEMGTPPKAHLLGKMEQGHFKKQPLNEEETAYVPGQLKMRGSMGEKISSRKPSKSRYLPKSAHNLRPQEKISRPQNRMKATKARKKK